MLAVVLARPAQRAVPVLAGQLLGFAVVVGASAGAGAGLLALPRGATAALGLVPIALGVRWLLAGEEDDAAPARLLGVAGAAWLTIANGVDDVAVFAPLLAALGRDEALGTIAVWGAGALVLCAAAVVVASRPAVARAVDRAGDRVVPVVLVALGVFIVAEAWR